MQSKINTTVHCLCSSFSRACIFTAHNTVDYCHCQHTKREFFNPFAAIMSPKDIMYVDGAAWQGK